MSDILHRVGIDAKPDKVFDALTTIQGLRGWWSSTASGSAAKDDIIKYGFCDMQVIAVEPGNWCIGVALSSKSRRLGHPIPHDLKIAVNG
jgi:hypothetical protein